MPFPGKRIKKAVSKRRKVFHQLAKQEFLWRDMDGSPGGSRVEIPEKLICAGRKGADRDIDRAMGKDDDIKAKLGDTMGSHIIELFRYNVSASGDVKEEDMPKRKRGRPKKSEVK